MLSCCRHAAPPRSTDRRNSGSHHFLPSFLAQLRFYPTYPSIFYPSFLRHHQLPARACISAGRRRCSARPACWPAAASAAPGGGSGRRRGRGPTLTGCGRRCRRAGGGSRPPPPRRADPPTCRRRRRRPRRLRRLQQRRSALVMSRPPAPRGFVSLKGLRQSRILKSWTCRRFRIILGAAGTRSSCIWRRFAG